MLSQLAGTAATQLPRHRDAASRMVDRPMAKAPQPMDDDDSDDDGRERQTLLQFEGQFSERLGASETCCRCLTLSTGVQIIAVLVILNAINHTMNSIARSGAPCYYWWKYWATLITFVLGHAVRLAAVPFAVLGLLGARKGEDKGPRLFFYVSPHTIYRCL